MKKKTKSLLVFLVILTSLAMMLPFVVGGVYTIAVAFGLASVEDHSFEEQKQNAISEAIRSLDQAEVCLPERTCRGKRVITVMVVDKGFSVIVYGIQDEALLSNISEVFTDKFYITPEMKRLEVTVYPFSEKDRGFLNYKTWFVPPIFHIGMKRKS